MKRQVLIAVAFLTCFNVFSEQFAFTSDGKKVLLKDDGTWQFAENSLSSEEQYDFRKAVWGMTKEQIKSSESSTPVHEENNGILYKGKINNLDCYYIFIFAKNQLVRAKYIINEEHTNKNDYIIDYGTIKNLLSGKYGDPDQDKITWKNSLYKDDRDEWGFAISLGHLAYYSTWKTDTTNIFLGLLGDNYKINFVIEYSSLKLANLEKQEQEESSESDL